ncbi:reverse transcriptase domain-containing protein [Tanacetum coccineum]
MSFGLKNAGATYQQLVDKAFEKKVGRNLEVYVDDLVIKSHTEAELLRDIEEMFRTLRKINMKLNPKKCTFGVVERMLLRYMVGLEGIKLCPKKIEAVLQLPSPRKIKEAKGRVNNVLVRLPRSGWRCLDDRKGLNPDASLFCPGRGTSRKVHPRERGGGRSRGRTITEYLKDGVLPDDKNEANKLLIKADYVIREIHEGSCSMHARPRSVVAKAMQSRYYWPTMHRDARDMILKCKDWQVHRPVPRNPQQPLTPITSLWPFYKWGIDIAGPFPEGPGKVKFLIVVMDYFTKWIEAKAVATISCGQVKKFVWDNIVCHFGLPEEIVSDNGKQFRDNPFKDWCEKLNITQRFASAHRTMIKSSNGDTPFSLTYGTEAVIPAEIGMPTYRTAVVDVVHNDDEIRLNLDLLEERRERAAICEAKAKSKMTRYYNARVRGVTFKPGDYVYRSNEASHAMDGGKLRPK